jgi:hypothetical protein
MGRETHVARASPLCAESMLMANIAKMALPQLQDQCSTNGDLLLSSLPGLVFEPFNHVVLYHP